MRKDVRTKLPLHRDTLHRLDSETLQTAAMRHARGGLAGVVGIVSSDNRQCTYSSACGTA
jgi:hypothetical protein